MPSLDTVAGSRGRPFSLAEERVHSLTHGLGAVLALPGLVALLLVAGRQGDRVSFTAFAVYGLSLVAMLGISSVFHGLRPSRAKTIMATVDNDAVYVLIAGTYTAYCLTGLRGGSGPGLLVAVWALAALGIGVRTLFPGRFRLVALGCYLVMGWLLAPFLGEMRASLPSLSFALLLAGGISYTLGTVFFALDRIPWLHTLWHLSVLGGAACHFFSVLVLLPA